MRDFLACRSIVHKYRFILCSANGDACGNILSVGFLLLGDFRCGEVGAGALAALDVAVAGVAVAVGAGAGAAAAFV